MNTKSDDAPGELVHNHENPVGFKKDGFAPEQVGAPKAILHVADEGEP